MAGKPAAPLLRQAIERAGAQRPLVIGDRLDTDIAGGHAVDADSLLVLTGVSTAADVLGAPPEQRPTYLGPDLQVLGGGPRGHPRARRRHRRLDGEPRRTASSCSRRAPTTTPPAPCGPCAGWRGTAPAGGAEVRAADDRAEKMISTLGLATGLTR